MAFKYISSILLLAAAAVAQQCLLQFDGRVPAGSLPTLFDSAASPFGSGSVFGQNTTFGELIKLPAVTPSLFDATAATLALEVTLSDESIFAPSPDNVQIGFRRAELNPVSNTGTDASTLGVKTLHFSIQKDNARPLNLSHEYQLVFLETNDFSTNQFVLKTGTIAGQLATANPDTLVLQGNQRVFADIKTLFSIPFSPDVFHNFALVLDFNNNTTQIFYSQNSGALEAQTLALPNDLSGQGIFHFGALKKGVGENLTDVTKEGFQSLGIDEGVIYGGIFEEDSFSGCISLNL